jgi:2'-5' RNA ligase
MPDVALAHRPGVELVNAGSWQLLSGSWSPNRKDILAAVEAAQCPAVRRPRLKLGHLDPRFNAADNAQHDGTPSLGWFDNLRASDDGNTLIGDQVALPWLNAVQAAAYPDRSVEGTHNARCALGHVHPFVVTAVSLLGETPPGIPTLRSIKSIDDLPAALGVTASGEDLKDGESVQATVRAAAEPADDPDEPVHTGAMVALMVTAEDAARLAVEGGEAADELHLTLAYLGEAVELGVTGQQDIIDAVSTAVNGMPTVDATAFAVTAFNPIPGSEADTCLVYGVTGDLLDTVHDFVMHAIDQSAAGTRIPPQILPWVAHVTAVYTEDLGRLADLAAKLGPVRFDRVRLAFAGQYTDIPLIDWDEEPDDPTQIADDDGLVAAAAGGAAELKKYWLSGPGLAKWADKPHPWTALYKALRKFIKDPDEAKRTASQWYRLHFGHMPSQGVKASEAPDPTPDLPAAEPEQVIQPEEDPVSLSDDMRSRLGLDAEADEAAALAAIDVLKAKADTPAPAEPTAEMVAASAAATEKVTRAESALELMREELTRQSTELATIKASAASTVKASFFGGLVTAGKLKPADRETWEGRYDRDPQMVSEILGARADGSEVPVMASGTVGSAEPDAAEDTDAEFDREFAGLFSPKAG